MSKKRLEDIRKQYMNWLSNSHMGWLIEQAEIAQEIITIDKESQRPFEYSRKLERQNKRYREALEFYGDKRNYEGANYWKIVNDEGETARKALEEHHEAQNTMENQSI